MAENHWSKALRVARDSSSFSFDGAFSNAEAMNDWATLCVDDLTAQNVDKRDIAVGGDFELVKYDMYKTPGENWENNLWSGYLVVLMIIQLLGKTNPKILGDNPLPIHTQFDAMNGPTPAKNYTFLNNSALYEFEEFGLPLPTTVNNYSDIQYAAMDIQDLLDGEGAGTFDMVRVGPQTLHSINNRVIDAVLGLLKVGGVLHFTNTSNYQSSYNLGTAHRHPFTRFNRHIAAQANFDVYHVPMEQGMIIAKRLS
jgi:hypothetical protein